MKLPLASLIYTPFDTVSWHGDGGIVATPREELTGADMSK